MQQILKAALSRVYHPKLKHMKRRLEVSYLGKGEIELSFLPRLLGRDEVALDIGANIGDYLEMLSRHTRRVIAFEPQPACSRHLHAIGRVNCTVVELALSDRSGTADLKIPIDGKAVSGLATIEVGNQAVGADGAGMISHPVRTEPLDRAIGGHLAVGERIGFIKIDVEGHELAVLEGGRATIAEHRPIVMVETEFRHGAPVASIFAFFTGQDFVPYVLLTDRLVEVDVAALVELQSDARLRRRRNDVQASDYVNNVLFFPHEKQGLARRYA